MDDLDRLDMQTATCGSRLRVAGGPAADDAAAIAFTDPQGGVHALYKTTAWDFGAGDGIRIKFDGTQFWTAWTGAGHGCPVVSLEATRLVFLWPC